MRAIYVSFLLNSLIFTGLVLGILKTIRNFAADMSKNLYIISGCNGAGKTTASYTVLPEVLDCKEFVNADEIARGLSPFNPESVAIEAGRLMLQRIEDLLSKEESFSIETTLATKSYINLVRRAQEKGYTVRLIFFWLNSPELALQRIAERVAKGGHNIPEPIVRRRYVTGISNLFRLFMNEVDSWEIYDNSKYPAIQIARGGKDDETSIIVESTYKTIADYVK
jgi:predicted ABC-type ATPase